MNSLRKWFYRPRRDDPSLLAQFYYADEELNLVAGELDSFDGRKDPERCTSLVNQLRQCQDRVLNICMEMMDELLPNERAPRDFRVKFPDDVMQETLAGQLWFGAECLAAGSSILNREAESTRMRPLAKAVTKTIENVRNLLREQCLKPIPEYTEKIRESLKIFDKLFADFELSYVSAMVPVKSVDEHDMQQNVVVLFSDTLQRASRIGLVDQEQIDNYDPALMFTIPRLAIISGLVIFPDGPLNLDKDVKNLSELFRPFRTLLQKIRELLLTMSAQELATLEKCLCSLEEPGISIRENLNKEPSVSPSAYGPVALTTDFIQKFYAHYPSCRQLTPELSSLCPTKKTERNERKRDRHSSKSSRTRARQERQNERFLSRLTGIEERPRARRRNRRGSSQYSHYYLPQDQDTWAPIPYQNPVVSSSSNRNASSVNNNLLYPNTNVRHVHHDYYRSSSTDDHHFDGGRAYLNSGRQHPRQHCRSSRHRRERINTIICACGSSGSHIPNDEDHYRSNSQNYEENLALLNQRVGDHSPSDHQMCIYRNPNYVTNGGHNRYHEDPHYNISEQSDGYIEFSHSVSNRGDDADANRPLANIQNCVTNAVTADPEILSPSSLYEQEIIYPERSQAETVPQLRNSLAYIEVHYDECINPECCICDAISERQESQNSILLTSNDPESSKILPTDIEIASKCETCSCDSTQELEIQQENHCSETSPDSNEASFDNLMGTPVPPPLPPVPGARSIRTSYRPYARESSEEEKFDSMSYEEVTQENTEKYNLIKETEEKTYFNSGTVEGESSGSTSPHHSGTDDDEEVALALQAAEVAASWKARERFADSGDLIQRMFVCISGVADQLQTNYASDLRKILKCVFLMNQIVDPEEEDEVEIVSGKEHSGGDISIEDATSSHGSEQLSVESAEDALEAIGTPEIVERTNSPDEMGDLEEETDMHSPSEVISLRERLHSGSVFVRASVFNDHSHMQYASISPPTIAMDHSCSLPVVETREISDNDSPGNDVSCSSEVSNSSLSSVNQDNINLEAVSDSFGQICLTTTNPQTISSISLASVSAPSNSSRIQQVQSPRRTSLDYASYGTETTPATDNVSRRHPLVQEPPAWVPDQLAPRCMACGALFTVIRRRHHCRNCGKVFCSHCSRHSVPLPHFGIWKNVRVCNACFLYYVTSSADGSSALS